jgi:hypothetical protein
MIDIGPARESDVVLAFLKAEIDSPAYREAIQQALQYCGMTRQEVIDEPDLAHDYHNAVRALALESYRGYVGRNRLFLRFPKSVNWRRVELEPPDLDRLRYLAKEESWKRYSRGTRSPQQVAKRIADGELPELAPKVSAIQERLNRGHRLPELVAVEGEGNDLILIEGANRTTAYVSLEWAANVPAIIGNSPLMPDWHWFKD